MMKSLQLKVSNKKKTSILIKQLNHGFELIVVKTRNNVVSSNYCIIEKQNLQNRFLANALKQIYKFFENIEPNEKLTFLIPF